MKNDYVKFIENKSIKLKELDYRIKLGWKQGITFSKKNQINN